MSTLYKIEIDTDTGHAIFYRIIFPYMGENRLRVYYPTPSSSARLINALKSLRSVSISYHVEHRKW